MSIASFSSGLSGLNANATALKVIGNNLANLNTVGFKSDVVSFHDLVSQGGSPGSTTGLGVATGAVSPIFSQGSIESSRETTNAAIQGQGLFVVSNPTGTFYTRAGNFSLNASGALTTPDGFNVQGYQQLDPVTGKIITTGQPTDILIPPGVLRAPAATSKIQFTTNLNASAATGDTFAGAIQMYDSLGTAHLLTVTYTKTGAGAWSYDITANGNEVSPPTAGGAPASVATGTVSFGANGQLTSITPAGPSTGGGAVAGSTVAPVQFSTLPWANGAGATALTWDLTDASGIISLTGYDAASATSSKSQNGSPAGMIGDISIQSDGTLMATTGNGSSVAVAQLALATFNNPKGLLKVGGNRFAESLDAGPANVGVAGTGGRGTVAGSALEQSNVDIASEFTQMIVAQRGYQANSKSITVSDELLVDTLNIKR